MSDYVIYIRCRIVWASLALAVINLLLIGSLSTAQVIITPSTADRDKDAAFTVHQLPSDGHLNTHVGNALPNDVDCRCRQHSTQYSQSTSSTSEGVRIFYLVLLHNVPTIRDAVYLFRALRDPRHTVVFHVDQKVQDAINLKYENATLLSEALQTLQDELLSCPCGSRVDLQSVHSVQWSRWSMNLPTLWGMQLATSEVYRDKWDVFINLSGDTLPVYTPSAMANILSRLQKYNFVTSKSCETGLIPTNVYKFPADWHKRKAYTMNGRIPPPIIEYNDTNGQPQSTTVFYHFGSQWVILQKDFVQYLATELERNDSFVSHYKDHLLETRKVMTDETFLPTVLMHVSPFNETLPVLHQGGPRKGSVVYENDDSQELPPIYSVRYERMDEKIPSPLRHYYPQHPRYEVPTEPVEGVLLPPSPHTWGPYYLGIYDLANIIDSGALFLRKTSSTIDPNLYHLLPVDSQSQIPRIQWPPAGVVASSVPNWPKDKLKLMKNAVQEAHKAGQEVPEKFQKEMDALERQIRGASQTTVESDPSKGDSPHEDVERQQSLVRRVSEGLSNENDKSGDL